MALSEGFRGFFDIIKGAFVPEEPIDPESPFRFGEDYRELEDGNAVRKAQDELDELYPTSTTTTSKPFGFTSRRDRETTNVTQIKSYKSSEIAVIEPRSFSDANQIVKSLMEKKYTDISNWQDEIKPLKLLMQLDENTSDEKADELLDMLRNI